MSMKKSYFLLFLLLFCHLGNFIFGQEPTGMITGFITDKNTQEKIPGVVVQLENTTLATTSDINGYYRLEKIPVGSYNLKASILGYQPSTRFNINVTSGNIQVIDVALETESKLLKEINIVFDKNRSASPVDMITPLSVQSLTTEEIRSNPGGNFDISKVIQVLPGVAGGTAASFRNDIVIRGGAPNENVFYLDGIEIPVLNHFQTQGSSGGPAGILNVSFIEDVKLSTSAFDARYDNALASVFQFNQRNGNKERFSGNIRTSSTEVAATVEGPLSPKTTFIASARRSYLQALFKLLDLPIRPNYWDFQYKVTTQLNEKTTLSFIGLGAIDEFSFAVPKESTPDKTYILNSVPSINQWTYTTGVSLKRLVKNGYVNVALSRNVFNNQLDRFENKTTGTDADRILKLRSEEAENKLRIDLNKFVNGWKWSAGISAQQCNFSNSLFNRIRKEIRDNNDSLLQPALIVNDDNKIDLIRMGAFAQVARYFLNDRLLLSAGIRSDINSFTTDGNDPLASLSPRFSASWKLRPTVNLNASVGRYYKLPPYTVLGYREGNNYVNNTAKYIRSDHYVAGIEYLPKEDLRFTVEGFVKNYGNYPVSFRDGISLANQGSDFGFIGNERTTSTGKGRAYGFEIYGQQKLVKNYFAVVSYTFVRSKFAGNDGQLIASAWDYRHLFSALIGKKFKRSWEVGIKYRYFGGAPYTPFDETLSRLNFYTSGLGIADFSRLNTLRLRPFSQLDIRIDKKINFKRSTLDLYLDVTNALAYKSPEIPKYSFKRTADNSGFETTDGQPLKSDGSNGIPVLLQDETAIVTPSLGIILEF